MYLLSNLVHSTVSQKLLGWSLRNLAGRFLGSKAPGVFFPDFGCTPWGERLAGPFLFYVFFAFYAICNIIREYKCVGGGGGWGWEESEIKKSHFMFSSYFMLFATFFRENWGGGKKNQVSVTTALWKPDHIIGSPVVTSIQVSFLGHADISSWNRWLGGGVKKIKFELQQHY